MVTVENRMDKQKLKADRNRGIRWCCRSIIVDTIIIIVIIIIPSYILNMQCVSENAPFIFQIPEYLVHCHNYR